MHLSLGQSLHKKAKLKIKRTWKSIALSSAIEDCGIPYKAMRHLRTIMKTCIIPVKSEPWAGTVGSGEKSGHDEVWGGETLKKRFTTCTTDLTPIKQPFWTLSFTNHLQDWHRYVLNWPYVNKQEWMLDRNEPSMEEKPQQLRSPVRSYYLECGSD